jgi:hypothetical protein
MTKINEDSAGIYVECNRQEVLDLVFKGLVSDSNIERYCSETTDLVNYIKFDRYNKEKLEKKIGI